MSIFLIIGLIVVLYWRTLGYRYIIDDNVLRNGYMYEVPLAQPPQDIFYKKPSKAYRLFMIGMHAVNVWIIYMLWGWCPALLFAVHPLSAWGVAWVTGNYYTTTAYFCLISYYIIHTFPNIWGVMVAMPIFAAALNSTICCVSFPFLFFLTGNSWGCYLFIPLAIYLGGRRFLTGIKIRDSFKANKPLDIDTITYKRIFLMVKVMAKYTTDFFLPNQLGLFSNYGQHIQDKPDIYNKFQSADKNFWVSLLILAAVFAGGWYISPFGTLWYFVIIALHSQWRMTGQFYAQRYHYFAIIGLCIICGTALQHYPMAATIVATALCFRTWLFIPTFRSIEDLYKNDIEAFSDNAQCYSSLAQFYLNSNTQKNPLPAWRINEIGMLLFRAEDMDKDDWAIKMNVACFFAMLGQWPQCMEKTGQSLKLVKPLGGLPIPAEILEKQVVNVSKVLDQHRIQVRANIIQNLELAAKSAIELIEEMKNPSLKPIQDCFKDVMATIEVNKPKLGFEICMDISSELNQLIGMIEKNKIVSDPDIIQLKLIVGQVLEARKKLQSTGAANAISPPQAQIEQKAGT